MTNQHLLPDISALFLENFTQACEPQGTTQPPARPGRPPRLPLRDIVAGLVWHVMQSAGTLAQSLAMLCGQSLSESALSERRQTLGAQPWIDALPCVLRTAADATTRHLCAFYKGWHLTAIDGTTFNVANTPPMKCSARKSKARRGYDAFPRLSCVVLAELGTHAPLAVHVGQNSESEAALAREAIKDLQPGDLLLGDRYYGAAIWVMRLQVLPTKPGFLIRVPEALKAKILRYNSDGTTIVEVKSRECRDSSTLREIKAKVRKGNGDWVYLRFWTNLLDHILYPALELVALYAKRWEQEIAFRELKHHLQDDNLLLSHTPVTAAQEICALFMAQAIVAGIRSKAATEGKTDILQISFRKALEACRNLGWLLSITGDKIPPPILAMIVQQIQTRLQASATKKRRRRSCPRKVRQPINSWPRLLENTYTIGDAQYELR